MPFTVRSLPPLRLALGRLVVLMAAGSAAFPAGSVAAQNSLGKGPVSGASFERFGALTEGPVAFGYHRSRLTNAGPAEDVAVRFFPAALVAGVITFGVDAGLMQAVAVGPVGLFVKGGVTSLVEPTNRGIIPGLQAGAGAIVRLQDRGALRVDVTRHQFYDDESWSRVWSFSIGMVVLPPAGGHGAR